VQWFARVAERATFPRRWQASHFDPATADDLMAAGQSTTLRLRHDERDHRCPERVEQ
jgi:hypothetical protein